MKSILLFCLLLGACAGTEKHKSKVPSSIIASLASSHELCVKTVTESKHLNRVENILKDRLPWLKQQIESAATDPTGVYQINITSEVSLMVGPGSFTMTTEGMSYSFIFLGGDPDVDRIDNVSMYAVVLDGVFEWQRRWKNHVLVDSDRFNRGGVSQETFYLCNTPNSSFRVDSEIKELSDIQIPTVTFQSDIPELVSLRMTYATLPLTPRGEEEIERNVKYCAGSVCGTTQVTDREAQVIERDAFGGEVKIGQLNLHEPVVGTEPWIRQFVTESMLELIEAVQCKGRC